MELWPIQSFYWFYFLLCFHNSISIFFPLSLHVCTYGKRSNLIYICYMWNQAFSGFQFYFYTSFCSTATYGFQWTYFYIRMYCYAKGRFEKLWFFLSNASEFFLWLRFSFIYVENCIGPAEIKIHIQYTHDKSKNINRIKQHLAIKKQKQIAKRKGIIKWMHTEKRIQIWIIFLL